MAYTLDSLGIKGMRATHFEQLMAYLENYENSGCYYGNKKQFDVRHEKLKAWLQDAIGMMRDPDARIPKK